MMTKDEIREAISSGIKEAFKNPELHCRYRIAAEKHDAEHLALEQFLRNMGKISDIKFFVLRWAVVAALTLVATWASWGILAKIKLHVGG